MSREYAVKWCEKHITHQQFHPARAATCTTRMLGIYSTEHFTRYTHSAENLQNRDSLYSKL